ncbi:unnamed protein product [Linum trigynum]
MCIGDGVESFSFPDHYCSPLPIGEESGLGKVREKILVDLVKLHYASAHRREHATCIESTVQGSAMWAQAECVDPTSDHCIGCLMTATGYLDHSCMYFSGGHVSEESRVCAMRFGDYDVCAQ